MNSIKKSGININYALQKTKGNVPDTFLES